MALCMLIMLVPSSVSADETDYKEIYFDFLKDELITKNNWIGATLADLNLDGTPELIMYDGGASASAGVNVFQIIDNKVQLRSGYYGKYSDTYQYLNKDYLLDLSFMGWSPSDFNEDEEYTFSLRRNIDTGKLMYIHFCWEAAAAFEESTLLCFSEDALVDVYEKSYKDIVMDEGTFDIISSDYRIDGNAVSAEDYDAAYNEFLDTWQDTGYELKYLEGHKCTEQKIRDFLNYYIPEKQFLGIADEEDTNKYGYVDVMPISRQEFDDRYEIKVSYKNNSSETITNKRIVLACTTLTNSKTKRQSEVVAAYKDSEDVFNPYEEKIVTTRIHCKKTADGIPYVIGDKPFSSNYRRYHSFLDDMTLITVQFANDKEYNDFMAEIEANHLTDLSTDEYIESNSMWLKTFKGDK